MRGNPSEAKPANTPASPRFSCIPSSDGATGSASPDNTNAVPRSNSPRRPCLPDDDPPAASRTPGSIRAVQHGLRQPFVKLQESLHAAVADLKISPPTAVSLPHHRRPDPHILLLATQPRLPVSPHLVKSHHRRRPAAYHAGGAKSAPPAHPRQCGGPL